MNRSVTVFVAGLLLSFSFTSFAQTKPSTVVKPQYSYDFDGSNSGNQAGVGNIPESILVTEQPEIVATTTTETEITVTTELGEITLPLATSTEEQTEEPQRLAEVVERINQDYEVSVQECRNGSWLEKIWCKISSWF